MTIQSGKPFEDVLDEMLFERGAPTVDTVAIWAALYPEHRASLIEFAASWAEDTHLPLVRTDDVRQRSIVVKTINRFRAATAPAAPSTLSALAASAGKTMDDVAQGLGIDASVISKLNARRIEPRTIGSVLVARLAKLLQTDAASVIATWTGAPAPLAAAAFLRRPVTLPRETLKDALLKAGAPATLIVELVAAEEDRID